MVSIIHRFKELFETSESELGYRKAKKLASHDDPRVRQKLASRHDVQPELLYFLAEDSDAQVRLEIAKNSATPRQADSLLVNDPEVDVRSSLAEKIARLGPNLSSIEREEVRGLTVTILESLARDEMPKVRQIISETLQDVIDAPAHIIRQLAEDTESIVAGPVLENSPVLDDEDLLKIINSKPSLEALSAISRRRNVTSGIAAAIANSADKTAITELLGNPSAQIREETLDYLVEQSQTALELQEPLVKYPKLSAKAALRMAAFIADRYLHVLEDRRDFESATLMQIKQEVHRRVALAGAGGIRQDDGDVQIFTPNGDIAETSETPEK